MTPRDPRRLRVLISAYSCEPNQGSEPGIGWNIATQIARHHDATVLTRTSNRRAIEAGLTAIPEPHPRFVYLDLPRRTLFWKRGTGGVLFYYYLWQLLAYRRARRLHGATPFDLVHHITFGKYSAPSLLARLPVPFLWGPVGGGESIPPAFLKEFRVAPRLREEVRRLVRWCSERDPLVQSTARRSSIALATTEETATRVRLLGARDVRVESQVGLPRSEITALSELGQHRAHAPFRFVSIGRLMEWKGFHLGLRAFARAAIPDAEYWIIGDGPARFRLERLARELGVRNVRFLGPLSRQATLAHLESCHVLVHPSLHEAGGWVCLEAMAAGCPVICLDLGGPALVVRDGCGVRVPPTTPEESTVGIAAAMQSLSADPSRWLLLSQRSRDEVARHAGWDRKGDELSRLYSAVASAPGASRTHARLTA